MRLGGRFHVLFRKYQRCNWRIKEMTSIDQIFWMLSWDRDAKTQQEGIREAQQIKYLSVLFRPIPIQPMECKSVWENCAKVIASKSDETLERFVLEMFEWLQDINHPGAELIYNRLLEMPLERIAYSFQVSLKKSKALNDVSWVRCLLAFKQEYELLHEQSIIPPENTEC